MAYMSLLVIVVAVTVTAAVAAVLCRRKLVEKEREVERAKKEAKEVQALDEITSFFNYPAFAKAAHIQIKLARRHKWPVTLMILDIDRLEKINLHHSYKVGDAALRHAAEALESCLRNSDVVGRFGGSGFFLLMPECDRDDVVDIFERIEKRAAEPLILKNGRTLELSLTAGAVTMYGLQAQLTLMMDLAEKALKLAKEADCSLKIVDEDGLEVKSVDIKTLEEEKKCKK